jgi:glycosyltransferase involved in cell wall biosynthesis
MKIAYCATVQPKHGGLKSFNIGLCKALAQVCQQQNLELLLIASHGDLPDFEAIGCEKIGFEGNHFWYENFVLPSVLRKNKVNKAIFPHNRVPLFGSGVEHSSVIIHDLLFWRFPGQFSKIKWASRYFFMSMALQKADQVFAVSQFTADELSAFGYKKPVQVCLEGAEDLSHFPVLPSSKIPKEPFFLFVGARSFQKNLPGLLKGFAHFRKKGYQAKLVVAGGEGSSVAEVEEALKTNEFQRDILFPGFVSEEEKVALMKASIAFVFPSIYEGFGMPILEAQKLGVPLICSHCASLPEVAGQGALLCPPDGLSIGLALEKLFLESEFKNELIKKGFENQAQFSWERTAGILLEGLLSH